MSNVREWKVLLLLLASAAAGEPSRALSVVYQRPYRHIMFVPKTYRSRARQSRVLFLDEDENHQHFGKGEIDLTVDKNSKIKFDENPDYEFTSPGEDKEEIPSGNERFYEPFRFRQYPKFYQGRFGRPYAPSFGFDPYQTVVRNSYYQPGWKARSPRVVFPYTEPIQTNSHGGPGFDNVVFREQNFGTSDIPADDQALQDIGTGNADAFAERDANDLHRARMDKETKKLQKPMFIQTDSKILTYNKRNDYYTFPNTTQKLPEFKPITDEQISKVNQILNELPKSTIRNGRLLHSSVASEIETVEHSVTTNLDRQDEKRCPQGGTCEFFIYCWMVGGLLEGTCGGLLKGCCHRVAKAGILGVQDSNSIDYSSNEGLSYGPVINDESCGIAVGKQTAQRRIVGGDDAGFGTFPWQAYIRIGSSRCNMLMSIFELIGWKQCWIERCGGSLISRRHVVTAGHCVARAQPRHVRVTLGDYVINSAAEPLPAYTFGVRTIKVHPLFKFTPQADRFDVAVLTLDRNVHYMPHIAPICLPERGSDFLGQYGWAAGWGALSPGSRLRPRTLQAVDVPVLDNRVCERWHRANGINVVIYPEMLCAGYRGGGKDSCQGDSGGPLMLERAGRWYLIGVVSAGYSCASRGQPGIYHRVAHTVDWISHATTLS
ncbi:uncharacterized protein LOC106131006 [Amyelois transitella]|uniref:uncharacterized protein LOC106131006 n=1 Tax=Amyelois transitella TaxID=680683 RepID=UPI00067BC391|nr:uncharacterized protein LOC106131006 [Amyelois transitella]